MSLQELINHPMPIYSKKEEIFNTIGDELLQLCKSFDESLNGILIKHGLLKNN